MISRKPRPVSKDDPDKQRPLASLAKGLNLPDIKEKMILTEEEKNIAINHAIESYKEHKRHMVKQYPYTNQQIQEIESSFRTADWSKILDLNSIIKQANSSKHQTIWHTEQRMLAKKNEEKRVADLKTRCDARYMYKLLKYVSEVVYEKKLLVNDNTLPLITALCYFLSEDDRFESELGYDFKKGLLIRGVSGVGKTYIPMCLSENELNPILISSMIEITEELRMNGEFHFNFKNKKVLYLDDVGTEQTPVKHYGTPINFFKDYIELVYLKNNFSGFGKMIVSTNLSFDQIQEKYSFRVRSRMKEMFNILDVESKIDLRGLFK